MDKCYACDAKLVKPNKVRTKDDQMVYVGPECYKKIKAAGDNGYQPPKGGPKLFLMDIDEQPNFQRIQYNKLPGKKLKKMKKLTPGTHSHLYEEVLKIVKEVVEEQKNDKTFKEIKDPKILGEDSPLTKSKPDNEYRFGVKIKKPNGSQVWKWFSSKKYRDEYKNDVINWRYGQDITVMMWKDRIKETVIKEDESIPSEVQLFFDKLKTSARKVWADMVDGNILTLKDGWSSGFRVYEFFDQRYEDDDNPRWIGKDKAEKIIKSYWDSSMKNYSYVLAPSEKSWFDVIVKRK